MLVQDHDTGWAERRPRLGRIEAALGRLQHAPNRAQSVYAAMELEAAARAYVRAVLDTPRPDPQEGPDPDEVPA